MLLKEHFEVNKKNEKPYQNCKKKKWNNESLTFHNRRKKKNTKDIDHLFWRVAKSNLFLAHKIVC
jgi:hypothetical protein